MEKKHSTVFLANKAISLQEVSALLAPPATELLTIVLPAPQLPTPLARSALLVAPLVLFLLVRFSVPVAKRDVG